MKDTNHQDHLDQATSTRLAKLSSRPVDTSQIQKNLELTLRSEMTHEPATSALPLRRWWKPITSAAAAIVLVLTIGWLILGGGGPSPAMAAPAELAKIHFDVANELAPHLKVSSVAEANRVLAGQASGSIPVPELPGLMLSCCLHQHAGTTLTCALIELDGQLITVAIADGMAIHSPQGEIIKRGGKQFTAHHANGINMVMTNEENRWLCVMGEKTFEQLIEIAVDIEI